MYIKFKNFIAGSLPQANFDLKSSLMILAGVLYQVFHNVFAALWSIFPHVEI